MKITFFFLQNIFIIYSKTTPSRLLEVVNIFFSSCFLGYEKNLLGVEYRVAKIASSTIRVESTPSSTTLDLDIVSRKC